jgi:hypothetical protein
MSESIGSKMMKGVADVRIESRLTVLAYVLLVVGILGMIVAFAASGYATKESSWDDWAENGLSWPWILVSVNSLFGGIVMKYVFLAGAELLRLLKRLAGLPYTGNIS